MSGLSPTTETGLAAPSFGYSLPRGRRLRQRVRLTPGFVAVLGVAVVVGFLVLYPVGMLVFGSFWTNRPGLPGALTLDNYLTAYTSVETYRLLANTVLIMGAKTAIAAVIALALAWIVTRTDTPFRRALEILIITPFFVPGILEAIGWILLLSPRTGAINVAMRQVLGADAPVFDIYSLGGIVWVLALSSVSFMFLLITSALRSMDASLEEAARASGAGAIRTAVRVTLPLIAPAVLGIMMLSFIRAVESFEVPVLLGTRAGIYVFTNRIYAALQDYPVSYGLATALGASFIPLTLGLIALQNRLLRGKEFVVVGGKGYSPRIVRLGPFRWVAFALCLGYFLMAVALPMSQIVLGSFTRVFGLFDPEMLTFNNYVALVSDPRLWRGLTNTMVVCGVAAVITVMLSAVVAYIVTRTRHPVRRILDLVAWLPWTIPGVVAGLGFLWAYIYLPLPLYGTTTLLVIAFVTTGLPLGVRVMAGGLVQIGAELEESSRAHGAGWLYTFRRVMLPLVRPVMAAAALTLFAVFSRSVSPVVLLAGIGTELLSVLLFQYTLQGQLQAVSALAMVLLLVNVVGLLIARWVGTFGVKAVA